MTTPTTTTTTGATGATTGATTGAMTTGTTTGTTSRSPAPTSSWARTAGSLGAGPVADFDGDGTLAPVRQELEGLLGQEVVVLGRLDDDDDIEVYEIQGLTFRDSAGPAPWQGDGPGDALTRDEAVQAALEAVGEGSRLDSVDREDDDGAAWEVEVYDADGREQRVLLDASGAVLDIRPED